MTAERDAVDAVALLVEPARRQVFEHLQQHGAATVAGLTSALRMGRTLVAFHLGKLQEAGFVEAVAPDRAAPGVGRPAQRYRLTGRELVVSVPERRYDLLAGVLLDSLTEHRRGETAQSAALRAARRRGTEAATAWARTRRGRASGWARLEGLLTHLGYAPRRRGAELTVRNCPFDRFRETNTPQVCALNGALAEGYLAGLGLDGELGSRVRACPDSCCVVFATRA